MLVYKYTENGVGKTQKKTNIFLYNCFVYTDVLYLFIKFGFGPIDVYGFFYLSSKNRIIIINDLKRGNIGFFFAYRVFFQMFENV